MGRNLASAIELLGHKPLFITSLADDNLAKFARLEMDKYFSSCSPSDDYFNKIKSDSHNDNYNNDGDENNKRIKIVADTQSNSSCFALVLIDSLTGLCEYVVANLEASRALNWTNLQQDGGATLEAIRRAPLVVLDANLPKQTVAKLMDFCGQARVPIFLEPTDVNCLPDLVDCLRDQAAAAATNTTDDDGTNQKCLQALQFMSPNIIELQVLLELFSNTKLEQLNSGASGCNSSSSSSDLIERVKWMAGELMSKYLTSLSFLLVTMDKQGVLVARRTNKNDDEKELTLKQTTSKQWTDDHDDDKKNKNKTKDNELEQHRQIHYKHFEPTQLIERPVSGSGAGDCFAAGFISGYLDNLTLGQCVKRGFQASYKALNSMDTVPMELRSLK